MSIDVDKNDLICMVKGIQPQGPAVNDALVKKCGYPLPSGQQNQWNWNPYVLDKLSEEELYDVYNICRNSR